MNKLNIKKISIFIILLGGLFLFTGCGNNNVDGTLEDIMTQVYADIPEDERPMMLGNIELTNENIEGYLGTAEIEYEEALASESMVGAIAHSVVLVRTKDGADIEAVKNTIKENMKSYKFKWKKMKLKSSRKCSIFNKNKMSLKG